MPLRSSWAIKPPLGAQINWAHPSARSLRGYWLCHEGGGRSLRDLASGVTGTIEGDTGWTAGRTGPSLTFDGAGDYIALAASALHDVGAGPRTLAASFRTTSSVEQHLIGGYSNSSPYPGYGLALSITSAGHLEYWDGSLSGWVYSNSSNYTDGAWHQGAVVHSGAAGPIAIYRDGVLDGTPLCSLSVSYTGGRALAARAIDAAAPYNGQIEWIAVWAATLTPGEIQALAIDPYAMLVQPRRRRYSIPAGAGANTGAGAITFAAMSSGATGVLDIVATGSITLGAMVSSGTATLDLAGSATVTLATMTAAGAAALDIVGVGGVTFAAMTSTAAGASGVTGSGAATLAAMTGSATGALDIAGAGASTLDAMTSAAAATLALIGTGVMTFGALAGSGAGRLDITGAGSTTFAAMTGAGEGTVGEAPNTGAGAVTFAVMTSSAAATLGLAAVGAVTLGQMLGSASSALGLAGSGVVTFDAMQTVAAGTLTITGVGAITFAAMTQQAPFIDLTGPIARLLIDDDRIHCLADDDIIRMLT